MSDFSSFALDDIETLIDRAEGSPSVLRELLEELTRRPQARAADLARRVSRMLSIGESFQQAEHDGANIDHAEGPLDQVGLAVERVRKKLLDLSLRNALLNLSPRRPKIKVVGATVEALYRQLDSGAELTLDPIKPVARHPGAEVVASSQTDASPSRRGRSANKDRIPVEDAARRAGVNPDTNLSWTEPGIHDGTVRPPASVQTLLYPEDLDRLGGRLVKDSRLLLEETGSNFLHVTFGMLEWNDVDGGQLRLAPLILLPAEMKRRMTGSKGFEHALVQADDDPSANVSLQEKLKQEFGIALPDFDEEEGPAVYLAKVRDAIKGEAEWSVRGDVCVCLLEFGKILMYTDLHPKKWPRGAGVANHRLIQKLFGSDSDGGSTSEASDFSEDKDLLAGTVEIDNPPLVMDADSSQHSAILDSMDGRNLVIEGPPGTGKSQTITNLIAAFLAQKKSVLFVAEKRAALEVVHNRLVDVGLGQFLLELHSDHVKKTRVSDHLGERLTLRSRNRYPDDLEAIRTRLSDERDQLSAYASALAAPLGRSGRTVHEGMWEVSQLRRQLGEAADAADSIHIDDVLNLNLADIEAGRNRLADLVPLLLQTTGHPLEGGVRPWEGIDPTSVDVSDTPEIRQKLRDVGPAADVVIDLLEEIEDATGASVLQSPKSLTDLEDALAALPEANDLAEPQFLSKLADAQVREVATKTLDELRGMQSTARQLQGAWPNALQAGLPYPAARAALDTALEQGLGNVRLDGLGMHLERWQALRACLTEAQVALQGVVEALPALADPQMADLEILPELLAPLAGIGTHVAALRHEGLTRPDAQAVLLRQQATIARLRTQADALDRSFHMDLVPASAELRQARVALAGARWWERLGSAYRAARKLHRQLARDSKANHSQAIADLEVLGRHVTAVERLDLAEGLSEVAGQHRRGIATSCEDLLALARWWHALDQGKARSALSADAKQLWLDEQPRFRVLVVAANNGEIDRACRDTVASAADPLVTSASADLDQLSHQARSIAYLIDRSTRMATSLEAVIDCCAKFELPGTMTVAEAHGEIEGAARLQSAAAALRERGSFRSLFGDVEDCLGLSLDPFRQAIQQAELLSRTAASHAELSLLLGWLWRGDVGQALTQLRTWVSRFKPAQASLLEAESALLRRMGASDGSWYGDGSNPTDRPYGRRWRRATFAMQNIELLASWMSRLELERRARSRVDVAPVVDIGIGNSQVTDKLPEIYVLSVLSQALRECLRGNSALAGMTGETLDRIRARFVATDRRLIEINRKAVAHAIDQREVPPGNGVGPVSRHTDLALVRREAEKGKGHIPLRQLMSRAGNALQALCPCWMMSPMSVARFCDPKKIEFDVVIMDEASQLRPEDALGAIARGRQVIVVGDRQQLPPTSFFQVLEHEDPASDGEEQGLEEYVKGAESILEVASTTFRPSRMLRWHYRSRHESLIAFSNRRFYRNQLVVFPSPQAKVPDLGVRFEYVPDGHWADSLNHREAERVVQLVLEHCQRRPNKSLAVVTMNAPQRALVEELLDDAMRTEPVLKAFSESRAGTLDSLIVKNLENIQGDERDVVIVSVTFGRNESGNIYQRFGAVSHAYGARRLNVLFTRARDQVIVVSSINAGAVRVDEKTSDGPRTLHDYLEFAESGRLTEVVGFGGEPQSPFEVEVAEVLRAQGYEVATQVGVGGYFIDLAVRHPQAGGLFVLGVECDGATYHSAKSARDRDRLRQQHLEAMGWRLHRIWSTDWFNQPKAEKKRLVEAVRDAVERVAV